VNNVFDFSLLFIVVLLNSIDLLEMTYS
jgi:hypothetical protein